MNEIRNGMRRDELNVKVGNDSLSGCAALHRWHSVGISIYANRSYEVGPSGEVFKVRGLGLTRLTTVIRDMKLIP